MNKKIYIVILFVIIILNAAAFYYYHLTQKGAWEKEKKNIELRVVKSRGIQWQEKYNNLLRQIKVLKIKSESLSQEIVLLQKEKQTLTQEAQRLRSPEYLADIIKDRIRLKFEVKDLEKEIRTKDKAIITLVKYKKNLEALLGKEKHLSQKLARSIADERKKGYSLKEEAAQKSSLFTKLDTKIDALENSQLLLRDKIKGLVEIVRKKDKEIKTLEKKLNKTYGKNRSLEDRLAQAKEEKELLEEELAATRQGYEEIRVSKSTLGNKLDVLIKEKEMLSRRLLEANEKVINLDEKLDKMEFTLSDIELEKKELEEKNTSFMLELTKTITLPETKAKILASSNRYNFVIINIGEEDGVKIGDRFSIYRAEKKIGEVEVNRIRSRSSFANITSLLQELSVTTTDAIR